MMGQQSKVAAEESTRFLTDGTPEAVTDIRDGTLVHLDHAPKGQPKLSFLGRCSKKHSVHISGRGEGSRECKD